MNINKLDIVFLLPITFLWFKNLQTKTFSEAELNVQILTAYKEIKL